MRQIARCLDTFRRRIPVALIELDVEQRALGEFAFAHQGLPGNVAPSDRQVKVAMAIGQAFALGIHPYVVLTAETVMDVQVLGMGRQGGDLGHEKIPVAVEVELEVGVAEVDGGHDVAMRDG